VTATTSPPTSTAELPDDRSLVRNASVLVGAQAVSLVVPLLTIPYIARVLGPTAWGPVLAAQGLSNWLILVFEYGFDLSATRTIARARVAPHTMADIVHGVQSAKTLLLFSSTPIILFVLVAIPSLRERPALLIWAIVFAVLRGFSPLWFFQGIERLKAAVAVDTATRALAALSVFIFVHSPGDGWRIIALQAVFAAASLAVLTALLAGHVVLQAPRVAIGVQTLREGGSIFAVRAWSGVYIQANTLILSALAAPATVAFFGGADRIIRAAINLLQPLTQAFLPRVSFLHVADPRAAQRTVRLAIVGVGLFAVAMGATATLGAPLLIHIFLGPGYDAAIPVLRLMGALPVLIALNTVLGVYWALPLGHERFLLGAIISAGVTNVTLALVFVPRWGATGMAASTIAAEVVALLLLGALYVRTEYLHSDR
jgi:polysaccharide transporter, PST family